MTVLQILNFGGEVPSTSSRTLPPGSARTARNLHPRVGEFRPLNEALDMAGVTVASGSKALHRLERKADGTFATDMTTGWLAYPEVMSFARGQINDDLTGRIYFSYDTGAETPPRVMDALGVNKQMGIPAPPKPAVTAIYGEEFTPDEYLELVTLKTAEIAAAVRSKVEFAFVGYDLAGAGTAGYINKTISGTSGSTGTTGGTPTMVTDPNNPGGALIPSTSTTGGTTTVTSNDFVIGGTTPSTPISQTQELENVVLTDAHRVAWSMVGLVAAVPVVGGGQTDFVPLYAYRTFTWKPPKNTAAFTFDRVQFEAWFRLNPVYE